MSFHSCSTMSFRVWRVMRQRASSSNFPFDGHIQTIQKASGSVTSQSFLIRIRGISSAVSNRISADGPDNGGPKETPEVLSEQDKVLPEGAEDKRMWRKWIEERLAHSGEETDASLSKSSRVGETVINSLGSASNPTDSKISFNGSSQVKETTKRSVVPEKRPSSLLAKNSFLNEDGKGPSGSEDSSIRPRLSPLDSIFRSALKPTSKDGAVEKSRGSNLRSPFQRENAKSSIFSDRTFNKNSSTGDQRVPSFLESAKRPSFFSERQTPSRAPQAPVDGLPVEALDDFEHRVLGSANDEDDSIDDDFLRDLDEIGRSARGMRNENDEDEDWSDGKEKALTDLALSNMEMFDLEDEDNPYRMRSDRLFFPGQTYDPEDLDLSKEAAIEKPTARTRKRYPSKEVFQVADFRNPRYLSKFIRESSRILPRRHYQISAKAQRKVAREIKTARILGLMPFTSMGDPPFRFLRSRSEDETNAGLEEY